MQIPKKLASKICFYQPCMKFKQHVTLGVNFLGTYDRYLKICLNFVNNFFREKFRGFLMGSEIYK
jgi:hypothetical protein